MSQDPYPSERPSTQPLPPYQQPYQQPYASGSYQPGFYQPSYQSMEGEKAAQLSLILGLVGFFVAGFVLGPLAIWQASKAESFGVQATAGKVLGWIVTILNVLAVLAVVLFFVLFLAGISASAGYST
ncbi:putative Tic20 family protein [Arthrobacter sp. PL16]|uniref:DUF4870 domain-containing protein n=1 Tax=Arthrobacter sp. PL16 TaxID=3071720 RepID=UPI002E038905|nr:putative Tic20 family protein [Arthrobacter sp. PL16]